MTNETRKRIEAYQKLLPDMRERVMAVAILLIMSVSMMISASFAWITLSRAPEVEGMQTTVASNGNLEIALAQGLVVDSIVVPRESQIGDSSATEGQSIVNANVTWGNLINVSDPTYGLSSMTLRPALLSSYNRTKYPLNGAIYGEDGRVVTTNDRYIFTSYEKVEGSESKYNFAAGDKVNYGVRAISSMGYSQDENNIRIDNFRNDTNHLYMEAQNFYGKIVSDQPNEVNTLDPASGVTCISALEGLVTVFAQDKVNAMNLGGSGASGKTSCSKYIYYTYQMVLLLQQVLEKEGEALLEMANWQAYVFSGDAKVEKTFETIEDLLNSNAATLKSKGVVLTSLESYKTSVSQLQTCVTGLEPMAEKCKNPAAPEEEYYWEDISAYVNILVHVNTTSMNGIELQNAGASNATELLKGGNVIVKKGALVDIEKRLVNNTNRVHANVKVSVKTIIPGVGNVKGVVFTDAYGKEFDRNYAQDLEYSDSLKSEALGNLSAKDNYGIAIDLWVRTNYPNAMLTLEGSAIYEKQREKLTIEGVEYELYTLAVGDENISTEVDVYKKEDKWYYVSTMSEVLAEEMGDQSPKEKYISVIVGYEGENRIWSDWRELLEGGYIEQDATTQGAGSCFVFYASTPIEQAKIMEMLEAFNVVFMDQNGDILGIAQLNLESAYSNQGKVTVPLEVVIGTEYRDELGVPHKGITNLTANTPTLITAIVYLNGSKLQNENVLSDGELQGQLNIQFGTNSTLIVPDNEELQSQSRTITAEVTVGNETIFNGTIGGTDGLDYKPEGYNAKVVLNVEGEQPEKISGSFIRVINSTQGTKDEDKSFVYDKDTGKWIAEFTLKNPGTYAFNTILVDGVQYTLHDGTQKSGMNEYYPSNRPYVYINGLKVESAKIVGINPGTYMTANSSKSLPVAVKIDAAVSPKQVNAQFFNADNTKQYTAILRYDSMNNQWIGSADIRSSDTYTLKYVSVDGDTFSVPATGSYTIYLGLRASVSTTVPEKNRTYDFMNQTVQFAMLVNIYDDTGKAIEGLSNVNLYYNNIISPAEMSWNGNYYEGQLEATRPGAMKINRLEIGEAGTIYSFSGAPEFMAINLETPEYVNGKATEKKTIIGDGLVANMQVTLLNGESAYVWAEMQKVVNGVVSTVYLEGVRESANDANKITFVLPREDGDWTLKRLFLQDVYDKNITYTDDKGNVVTGKFYPYVEGVPTESNSYIIIPNEGDMLSTDLVVSYDVIVYYGEEEKGRYNSKENTSTISSFTVDLTNGTPGAFLTEYTTKEIKVDITDYKGRKLDSMLTNDSILQLEYDSRTSLTYGGYTGANGDKIDATNLSVNNQSISYGTFKLKQAGEYNTTVFKANLGSAGVIDVLVRPKFVIRSIKPKASISEISPTGSNPTKITYTTKNLSLGRGTEPTFTATGNQTSTYSEMDNTATVYAVATADNSTQRHGSFTKPTVTLKVEGITNNSTVSLILPGGSASEVKFTRTGNGTVTGTLGSTAQINSWKTNWGLYTHTLNAYYGHGTQTISNMSITCDNVVYTVPLDKPIVITNPSSVNQ